MSERTCSTSGIGWNRCIAPWQFLQSNARSSSEVTRTSSSAHRFSGIRWCTSMSPSMSAPYVSIGFRQQHSQKSRPWADRNVAFFRFTIPLFLSRRMCATSFLRPSGAVRAGSVSLSFASKERRVSMSSGLASNGTWTYSAEKELNIVAAEFSSAIVLSAAAIKARWERTSLPSSPEDFDSASSVSNLSWTWIGIEKCLGVIDSGRTLKIGSFGFESIENSIDPIAHLPFARAGSVILSRSLVGLGRPTNADTRFGTDKCVRLFGYRLRSRRFPPFLAKKVSVWTVQIEPSTNIRISIGFCSNAESIGLYSNSPRPPLGRHVT